jgi:hypothetical protein
MDTTQNGRECSVFECSAKNQNNFIANEKAINPSHLQEMRVIIAICQNMKNEVLERGFSN